MNIEDIRSDNEPAKAKQEKQGFLQSIIESLFKSSSPEAEKKRKLKAIAKAFSKTKFHNYYKPATIEALAPMAKLFYDIYKLIAPAQLMFKGNPNPAFFKNHILNYSLTEKQVNLLEHFSEEKILSMTREMQVENIVAQIEADLETFMSEFTSENVAKAENLYTAFNAFRDFVNFDYYKMLKKFTNRLVEFNFSAVPTFEKINAEYIIEDLADFCAVAYAITDDSLLWNNLFDFFKETQHSETVSLGNWKRIVARIRSIQASEAFEMIIRHTSGKLNYKTKVEPAKDELIEVYQENLETNTRKILTKLTSMQRASKANQLCMQIFGNTGFKNLNNYTEPMNEIFSKKQLATYTYAKPLNYLKTFLTDFVKKDVRIYYDVVVIRGAWDSGMSAPMSNAYQELLQICDQITAFDEGLAEDGVYGTKIKNLLPKTARDPGAEQIINRVITDSNDQAKGFLISSTQNLITIGKTMKQLIEDYMKQKPMIVQNWKELERFLDAPMKDFSVNIYKKIYMFVQLMQQYLNNNEED